MNRFLKINSLWLSLLGLAVLIVVLAFVFRPMSHEYQITSNQALKLINNQFKQIDVKNIAEKQIIDIRSENLFAEGHPGNAINIPIRQLLDDTSIEMFDQFLEDGKEVVLYDNDELQATSPWLLLQQLGYHNIFLLKGHVNSVGELVETELASSETSVVDISVIRQKSQGLTAPNQMGEKKKPEIIKQVRKEASSGGGC